MKVIISWSGGKDSCLALYKAIKAGHQPVVLLNYISEEHKRCCFHGVPMELIKAQADSLGIPLEQKAAPATMEGYEKMFKEAVRELMAKYDAEGMVFGDIYLLEHQSWVERVCGEIGVKMIEPLWEQPVEKLIDEFLGLGFKTTIVSAKADIHGENFVGRDMSPEIVQMLKAEKACVCGENGEYHTFVYDGPLFKNKISITKAEKTFRDGFWKHWFLDIQEFA
ncbi:MAG: diphthine--ammonia ligase [Elusimicrobiota bacterium]